MKPRVGRSLYSKGDGTQANTEWVVAPDGKWYYFDEDGEMAHDGWEDTRLHDGSWAKYYFDSNGHYAVNTWHYNGDTWSYSKGDEHAAVLIQRRNCLRALNKGIQFAALQAVQKRI